MSTPMRPGGEPGESEFSFGPGMVPNQSRVAELEGANGIPTGRVGQDLVNEMWADHRTDTTDPTSVANYEDLGNPDRYGGQPPLVRESDTLPAPNVDPFAPGGIPGAIPKTGVTRAP